MIPQLNSGEKCEKQLLADEDLPPSSPIPITSTAIATKSRSKFVRDVNVVAAIEMVGCCATFLALTVEVFKNMDKNPMQNLFRDWFSPYSYAYSNSICSGWPYACLETSMSNDADTDDLSGNAGIRYNLRFLVVFLTFAVLIGKLHLANYLRKLAATNGSKTIEEINRRPFYLCIGLQVAITYLPTTLLILPLLCATNSYPFAAFFTQILFPISAMILLCMTIITMRFILSKSYDRTESRPIGSSASCSGSTSSSDLLRGFRILLACHFISSVLILLLVIGRRIRSISNEYHTTVSIWDPLICKENNFWETCVLEVEDGNWSASAMIVLGAYLLFVVLKIVVDIYLWKWVAQKKTSADITGGHLRAYICIFIGSGVGSYLTIHYFGLLNLLELDPVQNWEWMEIAFFRLPPIIFLTYSLWKRNSDHRRKRSRGLTAKLESYPSPVDGVFTISNEGVVKA